VILVVGVAAANHGGAHLAGTDGWVDGGVSTGPDVAVVSIEESTEVIARRVELSSSRPDGCISNGRWICNVFGETKTQMGRSALRLCLLPHFELWLAPQMQDHSTGSQPHFAFESFHQLR
jgi:hypothetical protein